MRFIIIWCSDLQFFYTHTHTHAVFYHIHVCFVVGNTRIASPFICSCLPQEESQSVRTARYRWPARWRYGFQCKKKWRDYQWICFEARSTHLSNKKCCSAIIPLSKCMNSSFSEKKNHNHINCTATGKYENLLVYFHKAIKTILIMDPSFVSFFHFSFAFTFKFLGRTFPILSYIVNVFDKLSIFFDDLAMLFTT